LKSGFKLRVSNLDIHFLPRPSFKLFLYPSRRPGNINLDTPC
jgi:hypothetical protein